MTPPMIPAHRSVREPNDKKMERRFAGCASSPTFGRAKDNLATGLKSDPQGIDNLLARDMMPRIIVGLAVSSRETGASSRHKVLAGAGRRPSP